MRLADAMRVRFAQRLADPEYRPNGSEFVAMAKLELQIENSDLRKTGGAISDEFKQALERLPRYVKERIIMSHLSGLPVDQVLELEAALEAELDGDDDGPRD